LRGEISVDRSRLVLPVPSILPPAERRRASRVVKLTLAIGLEAAAHAEADVARWPLSSAASGADGHNCHALCEQLASDDRQISPTRFHNSVHNAAAGYWGIATKAMAPCQVICAYDASFGAGLLDALGQVVIDRKSPCSSPTTASTRSRCTASATCPTVAGVALLLTPEKTERSLARITVSPTSANAEHDGRPGTRNLRTSIPALRSLPLLQKLARGEGGCCLPRLPAADATQHQSSAVPCQAFFRGTWAAPNATPPKQGSSSPRRRGSTPKLDSRPRLDRRPHPAPGQHVPARCGTVDWSETAISCSASSHADPANPLRAEAASAPPTASNTPPRPWPSTAPARPREAISRARAT
jgi:hypothetical protein